MRAPRVFISHASEDRELFVIPLARSLFEQGVHAWVDRWEIQPGDSLVGKIFDEGLGSADAFVAVVSPSSVQKPWVREELDLAVVHRIERSTRLIPVRLGDVEMPPALRASLWIDAEANERSARTAADRIAKVVFGQDPRPTLGPMPKHLENRRLIGGLDETEQLILFKLFEQAQALGRLNDLDWHEVEAALPSTAAKDEVRAMVVLMSAPGSLLNVELSDGVVVRVGLQPRGFVDVWLASRPDRDDVRAKIVYFILESNTPFLPVNDIARSIHEPPLIVLWFLSELEAKDLVKVGPDEQGTVCVIDFNPKMRAIEYL